MSRALRKVGMYFGLVAEPDGVGEGPRLDWRLHRIRPMLVNTARTTAVLAVVSAAIVLVVFDWQLSDVIVGGGVGTVLWGAVWFLTGLRDFVPTGSLLTPPADAVLDPSPDASRAKSLLWLLLVLPPCLGLSWLADWWDLGALFVPGQFLGITAAYFVSAILVARWERAHHQRAYFRGGHQSPELYGIAASWTAAA